MPLKTFGCSICGAQAPLKLRVHNKFSERMKWLWHHRKLKHPKAHAASVRKSLRTKGY